MLINVHPIQDAASVGLQRGST